MTSVSPVVIELPLDMLNDESAFYVHPQGGNALIDREMFEAQGKPLKVYVVVAPNDFDPDVFRMLP